MEQKKLTVLVIAPTPFFADRGTHIRILEEALALERRGHAVTIATYHIGREIPASLGSDIDVRRIRRLLFWYKKLEAGPDWQKIILDLLLIKKVFFLARTKRPDVIHGHLHEGVIIGWIVQKLLFWRKIILVADFHGSLVNEMVSHDYLGGGVLRRIFQNIENFINNLGDIVFASSWENAESIGKSRKDGLCEVLLDGAKISPVARDDEKMSLRDQYHVPREKVVVTYTGALIPNKGIRLFLDAIPFVVERCPEAHFLIAGFPIDQISNYLQREVFLKHATVVTPLSYFHLSEILALSDIGVDPKEESVKQASGKLLQYMGAGLPVACFDTMNNRKYLGDGGSYAPELSPKGLGEAILFLVEQHAVRKERGHMNQARAASFSWDIPAKQWEQSVGKFL